MAMHDLVLELKGVVCFACDGAKASMRTFCGACYRSLPPRMRTALYRRLGEGYESAYEEARAFLRGKAFREGRKK